MAGICLSLIFTMFEFFIKVFIKTGLWIGVALAMIIDTFVVNGLMVNLTGMAKMTPANYPTIFPVYEKAMIAIMIIPAVYVMTQKAIRLFSGNPDFSIRKAIFAKNR